MSRTLAIVTVVAALVAATTAGYAASFTLTSSHLGAGAVTVPPMYPVWVQISNKTGGVVGKAENGDTVTVVYSDLLNAPTICNGWTNAGPNAAATLQWTIVNGTAGANDSLVADGTGPKCTTGLFIGSINLGSGGYDTSTANMNFANTSTTITSNSGSTIITATLGGETHGTAGTVASGSAAVWTPNTVVTDQAGHNCGSNLAKSLATVQF